MSSSAGTLLPLDANNSNRAEFHAGEICLFVCNAKLIIYQHLGKEVKMKTIFSFLTLIFFTQIIIAQTTSFEGISYTGEKPPDPVIAVGNNYVVEAVNKELAVYDKAGNLISEQTFSSFFTNQTPPDQIFDPKLAYDQYSDRFIFLAAARNNDYSNSNYMLAVTQSSDPTNLSAWHKYKLTAVDNGYEQYYIDFPGLGYDEQAIYLTTDKLGNTNNNYPKITILKKSEVYAGSISFRKDFIDFHGNDGSYPEHLQPMRKFGSSSKYYLVNTEDAGRIRIWSIQNPISSNPTLSEETTKSLGTYNTISDATQEGSSNTIDMGDSRVSDVVCKDGYLYSAYTAQNTTSNGSMIVYFKVNTNNNYQLLINGKIEAANKFYYYPVLQPDNYGNIVFVFNQSSSSDYVGVAWTILYSGNQNAETPLWLKEGVASYYNPLSGKNRWGDYSGAALDPANNQDVWICGEWADNNNQWSTQIGEINTSTSQDVIVDQKLSNGTRVGYLKNWQGTVWGSQYTPPQTFSFPVNSTQTILGDQGTYSNQKYNNWNGFSDVTNHHSFYITTETNNLTSHFVSAYSGVTIENSLEGTDATGGYLDFRDPWLIDSIDASHGNQVMNRGMDHVIWHQRNSPFHPDYTTSYGGYTYKGVFLDQAIGPNKTYYNCWSGDQQIPVSGIDTRNFYFQGWTATGANLQFYGNEAWTEFTSGNAIVSAILKGQGLSNDQHTFKNGPRKFIQTFDGTFFNTYKSLNNIWFEKSSNTTDWEIFNDHQPLNTSDAEGASLDYGQMYVGSDLVNIMLVVYQEYSYIRVKLYVKFLSPYSPFGWNLQDTQSILVTPYSEGLECTPVVALHSQGGAFKIVFKKADGFWFQNGQVVRHNDNTYYIEFPQNQPIPTHIANTNSHSVNPSIFGTKSGNDYVQLVWEESNTIKYISSISAMPTIQTISTGDGYSYNTNPSLVVLGDGYARVCWRGSNCTYQEDEDIETQNPFCQSKIIFRGSNNSRFWLFGNNVGIPNINKANDDSYYALAWSQNNGASTYFADNTLSFTKDMEIPGNYVQVSNGPTKDQMYAEVFNTQTTPYSFSTSNSIGSYYTPQKATSYSFASGREGVVYKDTAQVFFVVGDINVNSQSIDFIPIPDSLDVNSKVMMNEYLKSENFNLSDNSNFTYSIAYGITDSAAVLNLLENTDKYISFELQLMDAQTNEVLGTFDEVTYDQTNLPLYENYSYQVNTSGIGNRTVYLRLVIDDNFTTDYALGELHALDNTLQKTNIKEKTYNGESIVKSYEISQNYPNPFNPSTTIKYQIPQDGVVTLKVYDILGREVANLVDGFKTKGRYEVRFDASKLATGVYIYRIKSGDFVQTKKMMLLK